MSLRKNYYFSSLFWNTTQKVLNSIVGFLTVPLLLSYFGKEQYGILSIATACNGYMHLLDLGMNTGAVRHFSKWKAEGNISLVYRVARTNLTFYSIIALINIIGLVLVAYYADALFTLTEQQLLQFRSCIYIIAFFSIFNWGTTTYKQLLIANKKIDFTAQMHCIITILKLLLIGCVFLFHLTLTIYFFWLTAFTASLLIPYVIMCKRKKLIDSIKPATYWKDFKVVLTFSISIFALSLFQMTATQSRPIVLGIFSTSGPGVNAEFRIIEVIPQMIITIGATFTAIFLPKTSEMVGKRDYQAIEIFAYKWTRITSIFICLLSFPFMLCSKEVLSAYVGEHYSYLSIWQALWCLTVLIQMHTTPGNAIVLAYGKTKLLVIFTAIACISSIIANAFLCRFLGVGSAVLSYFFYVLFIIGMYYVYFYKRLLHLSRLKMLKSFIYPAMLAFITSFIVSKINIDLNFIENTRLMFVSLCIVKSLIWFVLFMASVFSLKLIDINNIKRIFK